MLAMYETTDTATVPVASLFSLLNGYMYTVVWTLDPPKISALCL